MKKKIALVNQRYGLEVNGGSEYYTRLIAEKLNSKYDVEIITTKAIDYSDWANHYSADVEIINGIKVNRFPVITKRSSDFGEYTHFILSDKSHQNAKNELKWFEDQGPNSPKLIEFISQKEKYYDVFIFVTYLYYPSVMGIPVVSKKAIFIPTAHNEPYIHFGIFNKIFNLPQAFVFLTDEEKEFVHQTFSNKEIPYDVIGVGVDIPKNVDSNRTKSKYSLEEEYVIYAGRIDTGKSCDVLFEYFQQYSKKNKNISLVLVGKAVIDIPIHNQIRYLGFVSEQDKYDLIQGAKLLILPSMFESLSIAVLEALALKTPVLVNEKSDVLKGHVIKSNAGLYYSNYGEFEACLNYILSHKKIYTLMKDNGVSYIDTFYNWQKIVDKFAAIIDLVSSKHN